MPGASEEAMPRWKALPAGLHPNVHQLIVRLRRMKDRSELSTRQLAAKTGYSARSWQRYLNSRPLPPKKAVEAMAHIGGDDPPPVAVAARDRHRTLGERSRGHPPVPRRADFWRITLASCPCCSIIRRSRHHRLLTVSARISQAGVGFPLPADC
ncbi:helix-turn-helix domain-containing protein [Streptomyces sp. NPDC055962]|uniref:helix-turn-helix domain-containing protein n=1 Tax=Streptomyces sp. NPDC055962 TaxID=3345667 RepID=UPI0035D8A7E1